MIYRKELDSSGQALLTSHPQFLLTEMRSGTVLFLCLCLCLFQASSHQWNKRNKHKHKHKKKENVSFSCAYACALTSVNQALPFVHSYSTSLFTVITSEKAADFQNRLSLQCESLLVGSVGGRCRTQQQPGRWKRITFCGRYLCFSFTGMIRDSSVFPSELHRGAKCGCCGSQKKKLSPSSPKKRKFLSLPIKRLARQQVQLPCFLLTWYMYPDPGPLASENSDQMIRFNLFRFLSGKKCSSICPEKVTENSIQMVNTPC